MSKSTLFIAVQCCQCSTMQVKQQKKSSNKWNCVVCNEKQSVRKVYAQGYQAKDIRHVVQSFNMSRKFADDREYQDSSLGHFVEHLEGDHETAEELEKKKAKRRTDWTDYLDVDEDDLEPAYLKSKLQGKEGFVQNVVTELPEELMFKKPKLKGGFGSTSVRTGVNRTYKPQFSKKSGGSRGAAATEEVMITGSVSSDVLPGWNGNKYNVNDNDHSRVISSQVLQRQQKCKGVGMLKTGASRWAEYLAEDQTDVLSGWKGNKYNVDDSDHSRVISSQVQPCQQISKGVAMLETGASKWAEYLTEDQADVSSEWNANKYNVKDSDQSRVISSQVQQRQQITKGVAMLKTGASKWAEYLTEDQTDVSPRWNGSKYNVDDSDHSRVISSQTQQCHQISKGVTKLNTGTSRWAEYLTDDSVDRYEGKRTSLNRTSLTDDSRITDGYKVQIDDADLLVEEDIHPDFL